MGSRKKKASLSSLCRPSCFDFVQYFASSASYPCTFKSCATKCLFESHKTFRASWASLLPQTLRIKEIESLLVFDPPGWLNRTSRSLIIFVFGESSIFNGAWFHWSCLFVVNLWISTRNLWIWLFRNHLRDSIDHECNLWCVSQIFRHKRSLNHRFSWGNPNSCQMGTSEFRILSLTCIIFLTLLKQFKKLWFSYLR